MRIRVAAILLALCAALHGAAGPAHADAPPEPGEPVVERWSADPRLWLALSEWRQRLRLQLESSRELCTAGTLTEISWQISGGKPPYKLQVEGTPVNAERRQHPHQLRRANGGGGGGRGSGAGRQAGHGGGDRLAGRAPRGRDRCGAGAAGSAGDTSDRLSQRHR